MFEVVDLPDIYSSLVLKNIPLMIGKKNILLQVKRFTNDLLKVLKAQPSKQISILDLPLCFEKSLTRHFKISDYGVSPNIRSF